MLRPAILALLLTACGGEVARDDTSRAVQTTALSASGGTSAVTTAAAGDSSSSPSPNPPCPATGLWSRCAVLDRLDRAGLAPRIDSTAAPREAPLSARGFVVRVGSAQLDVYVYPTVDARLRDIARVDTTRYLGYTEAASMQQLPTLIQTANLVAILHSRNDHQRERVGDALTAGPPQPRERSPTQLPPASSTPSRTPGP